MQLLTSIIVSVVEGLRTAGLWVIGSAEAIMYALIGVLSSTGFWSVAAVTAAVGGVILYLVKTNRLLLV